MLPWDAMNFTKSQIQEYLQIKEKNESGSYVNMQTYQNALFLLAVIANLVLDRVKVLHSFSYINGHAK